MKHIALYTLGVLSLTACGDDGGEPTRRGSLTGFPQPTGTSPSAPASSTSPVGTSPSATPSATAGQTTPPAPSSTGATTPATPAPGSEATPRPLTLSAAITPSVAAGEASSFLIRADGTVLAWGDRSAGALGDGVNSQSTTRRPQAVITSDGAVLNGVVAVAAGASSALAVRADGSVVGWGANGSGRLGIGVDGGAFFPRNVPGLSNIVAVDMGEAFGVALDASGAVFTWGDNSTGQLGLGDLTARLSPTRVPGLPAIRAIAAGSQHVIAVASDGTLIGWGNNTNGQVGIGTFDLQLQLTPALVFNQPGPAVDVAGGAFHSLALLADSTVAGWGASLNGQVGVAVTPTEPFGEFSAPVVVPGLSGVVEVSAGRDFSLIRLADGRAAGWGNPGEGSYGAGFTGVTQSTPVPTLTDIAEFVVAIDAGRDHSLYITQAGDIGCSGSNFFLECGRFEMSGFGSPLSVGPGLTVTSVPDDPL